MRVNNLKLRLSGRYSDIGEPRDLEEAIQLARRALKAALDDHLDYLGLLTNLGARVGDQYSRTGAMDDLEEAIPYMGKAVDVTPSDHPGQAMVLSNLGRHLGTILKNRSYG